jgi:hypothetical protein
METKNKTSGKYTGPERYVSQWCKLPHFIVRTAIVGHEIYATVANGMQPIEGMKHPTLRDARAWMKDNGFAFSPVN